MTNLINLIITNKLKYQLNLTEREKLFSKDKKNSLIETIPLDVLSEVLAPFMSRGDYEKLLEAYEDEENLEYLQTPYIISKTKIKYPDFDEDTMKRFRISSSIELDVKEKKYYFGINANSKIIRIGKDSNNDIVLDEEGIEDFHAYIKPIIRYENNLYFPESYFIYNINTENPIYIKSKYTDWQVLNNDYSILSNSGNYQLKLANTIINMDISNSFLQPLSKPLYKPIKVTQITVDGKALSYPIELLYRAGGEGTIYSQRYGLHIGRYNSDMIGKFPYIGVMTNDKKISKVQLIIYIDYKAMIYPDPTNLVFLNGKEIIEKTKLNNGDIIRLGRSDIYFKFEYI